VNLRKQTAKTFTFSKKMVAIYCIVDNTSSMSEACKATKTCAAELVALGSLVAGQECVTMGVIGDYSSGTPDRHQGGFALMRPADPNREVWFNRYMNPEGGGGLPEAYKTALNFMLREKPGILLLLVDAEPHMPPLDYEGHQEDEFLNSMQMITDWDKLIAEIKLAGFCVVTFITGRRKSQLTKYYSPLGYVVEIADNTSSVILATMMDTLYALLDQKVSTTIKPFYKIRVEDCMKSADPEFVLAAFDHLLQVNTPDQAMCITTNPILGKYWRKICGSYRDAHEDKCQAIMDKLSQIMNKLQRADHRAALKEWLDKSHDEAATIRKIVNASTSQVAFILPGGHHIDVDAVLQLGHSGEFRELAKLIAEIKSTPRCNLEVNASNFICADSGMDTMRLLAHLLSPGLMFSSTIAMFAAILALSNAYLGEAALELLKSKVGKWINWELDEDETQKCPVFWSLNFMRLLKFAPDEVLTATEIAFRDRYLTIAALNRNHDALIDLQVPVIISALRRDVTRKRMCPMCEIARCFTVFPGDSNICGHCIQMTPGYPNYEKNIAAHKARGSETDPKKYFEVSDNDTHWAQCRTCHANYGVTASAISVPPKCYDCRSGTRAETVVCEMCHHKYLSPGGSAMKALLEEDPDADGFICPRCDVHPSDMITDVQTTIRDLIAENPGLQALVPVNDYKLLMDSSKKLWRKALKCELTTTQEAKLEPIFYHGFAVHRREVVARNIVSILTNTKTTTACCVLCLNTEVPLRNIVPSCGSCQARICRECVTAWYSQAVVGAIVSENHVQCPFCKCPPSFETVKHLQVRHFLKKSLLCKWEPEFVYACCARCLFLKPCMRRACAGEMPTLLDFKCDDCKTPAKNLLESAACASESKECPNCRAPTEHNGGCNHMTCRCLAHWCWACGQSGDDYFVEFTRSNIYDHMAGCGGIFPNNTE
jgi:hypothetical protein